MTHCWLRHKNINKGTLVKYFSTLRVLDILCQCWKSYHSYKPDVDMNSWDILESLYNPSASEWVDQLSVRAGHVIDKILSATEAVQFQGKIWAVGASNFNSQ